MRLLLLLVFVLVFVSTTAAAERVTTYEYPAQSLTVYPPRLEAPAKTPLPKDPAKLLEVMIYAKVYGNLPLAQAARRGLEKLPDRPYAIAALHLEDADDAWAALRWNDVVAAHQAAWDAVKDDEARVYVIARIGEHAVTAHAQFEKTLDPGLGRLAQELAALYLKIAPDGPEAEAMKQAQHDIDQRRHPAAGVTVLGTLDMQTIGDLMILHYDELKGCFAPQLYRDHKAHGHLDLVFAIDAAGKVAVKTASAQPPLEASVADCVRSTVVHWRFPAIKESRTIVTYPIDFGSNI